MLPMTGMPLNSNGVNWYWPPLGRPATKCLPRLHRHRLQLSGPARSTECQPRCWRRAAEVCRPRFRGHQRSFQLRTGLAGARDNDGVEPVIVGSESPPESLAVCASTGPAMRLPPPRPPRPRRRNRPLNFPLVFPLCSGAHGGSPMRTRADIRAPKTFLSIQRGGPSDFRGTKTTGSR